jgi:hypothetical protein
MGLSLPMDNFQKGTKLKIFIEIVIEIKINYEC